MKNKVISFSHKQSEISTEKEFIDFLDKDISKGNVEEIPDDVFERVAKIKHKALLAREKNEPLEM